MREKPLLHRDAHIDILLQSYYAVLNEDEDFRIQLRKLFYTAKRSPDFKVHPLTQSEKDLDNELKRLGLPLMDEDRKPPVPELEEAFERFAKKWKLPERAYRRPSQQGLSCLWWSYSLWKIQPKETPRLLVGSSQTFLPEPPSTTIPYDPTTESGTSLRGKLVEAQKKAKRLGYINLPPHHIKPEERRRLALRLYRRGVLGMKWEEIILAEKAEQVDDWPDSRTVRSTVKDWAKRLGIPLPKIPPGRPRRTSTDTKK